MPRRKRSVGKRRRRWHHGHRPVQPGAAPGRIEIDPAAPHPTIRVIAYGADDVVEVDDATPERVRELLGHRPVVWVDVAGLGDEPTLSAIAELFGVHRLALEDVVNLGQRPKIEQYDDQMFLVAQMAPREDEERFEQLGVFLSPGAVLTFQERPGDCFEAVRARIRAGAGLIRRAGTDYLAYALLDATLDGYFPVLERIDEKLDELEDEVLARPGPATVEAILGAKRQVLALRRTLGPHREVLTTMLRESGGFVRPDTEVYLRDCYDHVLRLVELVEIQREHCADLMGTYLSTVSNRMNEVMKVLTIIATIFIPLSFIAGLYGMNFDPDVSRWNMPELRWAFGYPFALGLMAALAGAMLLVFWRRGWFK